MSIMVSINFGWCVFHEKTVGFIHCWLPTRQTNALRTGREPNDLIQHSHDQCSWVFRPNQPCGLLTFAFSFHLLLSSLFRIIIITSMRRPSNGIRRLTFSPTKCQNICSTLNSIRANAITSSHFRTMGCQFGCRCRGLLRSDRIRQCITGGG